MLEGKETCPILSRHYSKTPARSWLDDLFPFD